MAKKLSAATFTVPVLWLDGTSEEIKKALSNINMKLQQEDDDCVE